MWYVPGKVATCGDRQRGDIVGIKRYSKAIVNALGFIITRSIPFAFALTVPTYIIPGDMTFVEWVQDRWTYGGETGYIVRGVVALLLVTAAPVVLGLYVLLRAIFGVQIIRTRRHRAEFRRVRETLIFASLMPAVYWFLPNFQTFPPNGALMWAAFGAWCMAVLRVLWSIWNMLRTPSGLSKEIPRTEDEKTTFFDWTDDADTEDDDARNDKDLGRSPGRK